MKNTTIFTITILIIIFFSISQVFSENLIGKTKAKWIVGNVQAIFTSSDDFGPFSRVELRNIEVHGDNDSDAIDLGQGTINEGWIAFKKDDAYTLASLLLAMSDEKRVSIRVSDLKSDIGDYNRLYYVVLYN